MVYFCTVLLYTSMAFRRQVFSLERSCFFCASISRRSRSFSGSSTNFSSTLAENREDLRETAQNFKNVSSRLRTMVDDKGPVVEDTVDRLAVTSARIDTLVTKLDALAADAALFTARLESDSTTLGKIMTDRELYDDLRITLRELNLLMQDVKRNPGKYFKFSLF